MEEESLSRGNTVIDRHELLVATLGPYLLTRDVFSVVRCFVYSVQPLLVMHFYSYLILSL